LRGAKNDGMKLSKKSIAAMSGFNSENSLGKLILPNNKATPAQNMIPFNNNTSSNSIGIFIFISLFRV